MNALDMLHTCGAHFVLCWDDKRPVAGAWQQTRPELTAVKAHAEAGGLVGVIPASLGCFVVDIDEGGEQGVARARSRADRDDADTERWLPSLVSGPGRRDR